MTDELTVIYNDTCPICSREVNGYKAMTSRAGMEVAYAGLSSCDLARFGLTPETAARRFHVLKDGRMYDGIPAFAVLWSEVPRLKWLAWIVTRPGIDWLAAKIYDYVLAPGLFAFHKRRQRKAAA